MKVGIVGATGSVGEEIRIVLEELKLPYIDELILYSSSNSVGECISSKVFGNMFVRPFQIDHAKRLDYIFLAVNNEFSLRWAEVLAEAKVVVIDCSSAFRLLNHVPLVIPEINIKEAKGKYLIASPNCVTAIGLMVLYPIHQRYTLKKVICSTYQSASGAGKNGMRELMEGHKQLSNNQEIEPCVFPYPLPYNIIPHIDEFCCDGYTKEEMKFKNEMQKILKTNSIKISCTAVRIPTIRSHSLSITIETERDVCVEDIQQMLDYAIGVDLVDEPKESKYPMPYTATHKHNVEVGRIRANKVFGNKGLDLFVCGDQLLRGASLNAVLILKYLMEK